MPRGTVEDRGSATGGAGGPEVTPRRVFGTRRRRVDARRRAYLLPSLFTVANMLLGFYAVVVGLRGRFGLAASLIFAAAVLDSLDGRIARMTGTESDFGREYDSLADLVTFGMAPALLSYLWGLAELGRVGWLAPLFFLVCSATRLARFNVQTRKLDGRYFVGLPTPAAAGGVASLLFVVPSADWKPWLNLVLLGVLLALALLMVSTFRYPAFKQLDLRRGWSYRVVLPIAAVLLLAAYNPRAFLVSAAALYAASGPGLWLHGKLRHRADRPDAEPGQEGSGP
ncbi:MAG TPA: CDP-diacylglycerol--serine O-phosphatidyltransferase [Thermoanaerobaculia bacterium]|nr:CDP-diacylglycerol--serine O-phosphatidyltransferase [Thermoanaerobaculia bacterium]